MKESKDDIDNIPVFLDYNMKSTLWSPFKKELE